MKRCPTCNRTFTDPNLSFCIEDGTPLVQAAEPAPDPEATVVSPSPGQQTQESWDAPAYQPPPQYPPPPPVARRRVWPWVVGSLTLLLLVLTGLGIAAAVFIPKMMRESTNRNVYVPNTNSNENRNTNSNTNINANTNTNANANESNLNLNQNENLNANDNTSDSPAPTDEDAVLMDLKNLEDEWTVANLNADKKKLARILADDYVSTVRGQIQGKADYLRDIKPDPSIQHWEFRDLKLKLNGSRATLGGEVSLESSQSEAPQEFKFTDKFVWRDSRWQAVSSEIAPLKESKN